MKWKENSTSSDEIEIPSYLIERFKKASSEERKSIATKIGNNQSRRLHLANKCLNYATNKIADGLTSKELHELLARIVLSESIDE